MATFTNRATLTYNGISTVSNTVTGTIDEMLTVNKNVLTDTYSYGSRLTYIVSLVNTGVQPATVTVTDDLGGYEFGAQTVYPLTYVQNSAVYYVNGALAATPTVADTQPLAFTGISVPAGGNALLIYEADVNEFAPLAADGFITNTVSINGVGTEALTAQATVTPVAAPALTITKALSPTSVVNNGVITYTFTILNAGNTPAVATDNLTVTDVFDPILNITSVTLNGAPLTSPDGYTYDAVTGAFATVPGVITVPAATYTQNPDGSYTVTPGSAVITVTGNIV
jgi:uncharacterized repeat protein (TIGR01451 family)